MDDLSCLTGIQVVKAAANRSQNRSSEPSYSSARTSDDEPSATPSAPSGDLGSQLQGGFPGLSRLGGTTSSQNGPNFGHRPGTDVLHLHPCPLLLRVALSMADYEVL